MINPVPGYTPTIIGDPEQQPSFFKKLWKNKELVGQGLLFGANALFSYNNQIDEDLDREDKFRSRTQQQPIFDYNNMFGPGTNGGSEFQPIIKAEDGAEVRVPGNPSMPVNIEGGEFLVLPDGTLELAKGPTHKKGGVPTILPDGTAIFSNRLKPKNQNKTFAELARKEDYTMERKILENPFSHSASKTGSERMISRKYKKLMELFAEQQSMNGNSNGEVMSAEKGGWIQKATASIKRRGTEGVCTGDKFGGSSCPPGSKRYNLAKTFKKMAKSRHEKGGKVCKDGCKLMYNIGGEYDLSDSEVQDLMDQGYKFEYL